jgi:hypothetical protein
LAGWAWSTLAWNGNKFWYWEQPERIPPTIGLLFKNIQLVNPMATMHASVEWEMAKPLGSKSEMSNIMTIFLGYAPVGGNSSIFKPKKNVNKKKGRHGKDKPNMVDPSVYPTLISSSNVDPDTITSQVTH